MNKITLFLMLEKGYTALERILNEHGAQVIDTVVLAKDPSIKTDFYFELLHLCHASNIRTFDRKDNPIIRTEYSIAIAWRWIIPLNETKLITIHDSLLPRYRGFAPLVNQLIQHEGQIGITAIFSSEEYDCGEIIEQISVPVTYPVKIQDAIKLISPLYADVIVDIISKIKVNFKLHSKKQNENEATYSLWRDENDYAIDWTKSASYIRRFVDAVGYPYKGATSSVEGQRIRLHSVSEEVDVKIVNRDCGKVIFVRENRPVVVCGIGLLRINEATFDNGTSFFPNNKFRHRFS
jgi:methionyl-tRNA formyltransferase